MKRHIFFDLDHTIWDFDKNAEETLTELYNHYALDQYGLNSCTDFIKTYAHHNQLLWSAYHLGQISKETLRSERFYKTFIEMGIAPEKVPHSFEEDYVRLSPTKTNLFEGSATVLKYLQEKYTLHIISNGFKETTLLKMATCSLNPYFSNVIISEDVGVNKPDPLIFEHALNLAGADKAESIMIGDSLEADIQGAQAFGMDAIFFNPNKLEKPAYVSRQIHHLEELITLF